MEFFVLAEDLQDFHHGEDYSWKVSHGKWSENILIPSRQIDNPSLVLFNLDNWLVTVKIFHCKPKYLILCFFDISRSNNECHLRLWASIFKQKKYIVSAKERDRIKKVGEWKIGFIISLIEYVSFFKDLRWGTALNIKDIEGSQRASKERFSDHFSAFEKIVISPSVFQNIEKFEVSHQKSRGQTRKNLGFNWNCWPKWGSGERMLGIGS